MARHIPILILQLVLSSTEKVPDITTVHTNFRLRQRGTTYVRCHVGPPDSLRDVQIYRVSGGVAQRLRVDPNYDEGFATASHTRRGEDPPDVFVCRVNTSAYSDITTIAYSGAPYHEPGQKNYRANTGDRVELTSTLRSLGRTATWFADGFSGAGIHAENVVFQKVNEEDTGVFLMARDQTDRSYSSATRLIVRACPAGLYGTRCDRRCPYCLHGGQCHEVTGQCVCPPGFVGSQCQRGCGENRFGASCASMCPRRDCEGRLLCAPDPRGCSCAPGWGGNKCWDDCRQGTYGPDCAFNCGHCKHGTCNRFTGSCTNGCSREGVQPPLCTEYAWPWFRDPPSVLESGFTRVAVLHRRWTQHYDNGFSNGALRYIGQIRPADGSESWTSADDSPAVLDSSLGENEPFEMEFRDLKADTEYEVRIIIEDMQLRSQQDSDNLIPTERTSTDCAEPAGFGDISTVSLNGYSVTFELEGVTNEREACPFHLRVTLAKRPSDADERITQLIYPPTRRALFTDLRPFTNYTVTVIAVSRKGSSPSRSEIITTSETAPSEVTDLKYWEQSQHRFSVSWDSPTMPNGVIRYYEVQVEHNRFKACTSRPPNDGKDVTLKNTTDRQVDVVLKHDFSVYELTVAAFTVAAGKTTSTTIETPRNAPKNMVDISVTGEERSALFSWTWPPCSTWRDDRSNLRLRVDIRGHDSWNQALQREQNLATPGSRIEQLIPYSNYFFRIHFCNSVGCSPAHQDIAVKTLESAPGPPENVSVVAVSPTSVTVGWDPPRPPLSRIAQYSVYWTSWSTRSLRLSVDEACSTDTTTQTLCRAKISNLRNNTEYLFTVYAINHKQSFGDASSGIRQRTREGAPGPPRDLRFSNRSQTMLDISWLEPEERNGRLLGFRLNVSLAARGPGRRRREAAFLRSFEVAARQRDDRQLQDDTRSDDKPYGLLVTGLMPGRRYLVEVAANTSAGFGSPTSAFMHTLVAPPIIRGQPSVVQGSTTDNSVLLQLPPVESGGGPVASYLVVVSTDSNFDGSQLEPDEIPNVEESGEEGLSYYVTAALGPERVARDNTFAVGDGQFYNSTTTAYLNQPLTTGATYRLGVAAISRLSQDNQRLTFRPIAEPIVVMQPDSPLLPILLVTLALLLIAAVISAILYRKRIKKALPGNRNRHTAADVPLNALPAKTREVKEDDIGNEDDEVIYPEYDEVIYPEYDEVMYPSIQSDHINYTRIELKDLAERTSAGTASNDLKVQLQSMPHGLVKPCTFAELAENRRKNRYVNLLAYDESRVVLDKMPGDNFSDYINANYIEGYNRPRAYIACQGPKKETVGDFWRMVWQESVVRIVMLTNLVEDGKRKCDQYWPGADSLRLPGMTVMNDTEQVFGDFIVRQFSIRRGAQTRMVTHFHYTAWPDHGVPMYPSSLAKFIKALNGVGDGNAPTVVHCSDGVCRTGTVILIDSMYKMGLREQAVDLCFHLAVIRQQRANLCANLAQYQLAHQVLVELLVSSSTAIPAAQLVSRLAELRAPEADGVPQLERQLRYLDEHRPKVRYATLSGLKMDGKNRSPEILPGDASRVFLDPKMPDSYINAVYVNSLKGKDSFIATEAPLPARKYMFWQMVVQKHSRIIVVMNDLEENDVFWPSGEEPDVYRDLEVQTKGKTVSDDVDTIDLKITHFEASQMLETLDVRVLMLAGAGTGAVCGLPRAPALLQLYNAYIRSAAPLGSLPAVVVCRGGVSGCGLFLAVSFCLEQLSEKQELDVMLAVSVVRRSRPQFITGLDQFELCYDVAVTWLEAFASYANIQ